MNKKKKTKSKRTQKQLLSSMRFMGCSLLLFSLFFFGYALQAPPKNETTSLSSLPEEELSTFADLSPHDTFNFFAVSFLFAALGTACLLTSKKK